MCFMCNGGSPEELLAQFHERIGRHGFTMVGVEPDPDHPPWVYTIGLAGHDHPELAVVGLPLKIAHDLLQELGTMIMDGDDLHHGDTVEIDDVAGIGMPLDLHLQDVDDAVLWDGDMFTQWHNYYGWRSWIGEEVPPLSALEMILCGTQPGVTSLAAVRPNRAIRRARARTRSQSGYRPLSA